MCTRTITEYCTRLTGGSVIVFIGAFRALLESSSCVHVTVARGFRVLWFQGGGKRIGQNLRLDNFIPYALVIALFIFPNLFPYSLLSLLMAAIVVKAILRGLPNIS